MKKTQLTQPITVMHLEDDKVTETPVISEQTVTVEQEESETWCIIEHNNESLSMSYENMHKLALLMAKAVNEWEMKKLRATGKYNMG